MYIQEYLLQTGVRTAGLIKRARRPSAASLATDYLLSLVEVSAKSLTIACSLPY
jgi:hypothetical protein